MGEKEDRRRESKRRLFRRDGWQDGDGVWFAMCSFGCADVIGWHEATIDLCPIKKCDGGRYTLDNTRLACRSCKAVGRNHKELRVKRGRKPGRRTFAAAQPMSVSKNIDRLEQLNARREAARGSEGKAM